jgi:N-acetylneuraminic acid mutarotase
MKVEDYLKKSNALDLIYQRPITKEQMQAEMNRMAAETKDPELLRELWAALGNDPYRIAECFARPILIDQLAHKVNGFDESWNTIRKTMDAHLNRTDAHYQVPQIESKLTFNPSSVAGANAPSARELHTAIYTGTQMIVWGGSSSTTNCFRSGSRYMPSTNTWTPTNLTGAPSARIAHTAVWTGTRMIVWGGATCSNVFLRNGGSYNPSNDTWSAITTTGAPSARCCHTAVWTGTRMVVWGGDINATSDLKTGGRYDPAGNSWMATNTFHAPEAREAHTAVWTGSEMIVWGGINISPSLKWLNTGGRYNPASDIWTATPTTNAPVARADHSAVWTGTQMVVWGGDIQAGNPTYVKTGGRYNPSTNLWASTTTTGAPSARHFQTAVWSGSQMIIWGGADSSGALKTGGRYNPGANTWTSTTTTNAPAARYSDTAVFGSGVMIIWGGVTPNGLTSSGSRYNPSSNAWNATFQ